MTQAESLRAALEACGFHEKGDPACRCPETLFYPAVAEALQCTDFITDPLIRAKYVVKDLELRGITVEMKP